MKRIIAILCGALLCLPVAAQITTRNGMSYTGSYGSGNTYAKGDVAIYLGSAYFSLVGSNTANTPASSPLYWQPIGVAQQSGDTVLMVAGGSAAIPAGVALPSCSGTSSALTYNTTTHAWGCNTISTLSTILTTKGDLLSYSTTAARFAVGANGQTVIADSTQTVGLKWVDRPVQISATFVGVPANSQVVLYVPATVAMTVPSSCTGSYAKATAAATGSTAFLVKDLTTSTTLCTATWSASGTTATFSGTGGSVAVGDLLQIIGPATADATLANIGVSIYATR